MARKKRVDSKGRVLKVGESQRKDGLYMLLFCTLNDASFFTLNKAIVA